MEMNLNSKAKPSMMGQRLTQFMLIYMMLMMAHREYRIIGKQD